LSRVILTKTITALDRTGRNETLHTGGQGMGVLFSRARTVLRLIALTLTDLTDLLLRSVHERLLRGLGLNPNYSSTRP
jgi:hypothetical protein